MEIIIDAFEDTGGSIQLAFCASKHGNIVITIPIDDELGVRRYRSIHVDMLEWAKLLEASKGFMIERSNDA